MCHLRALCSRTPSTWAKGRAGSRNPCPSTASGYSGSRSQDITVIVGNPPYSAGQRSAMDENPNVFYPHLAQRVRETYALRSTATKKMSLYDSYKLAIRWASDRIGEQGVIAFVTNGSFIDGNADVGLRACLADEFSHLYVFNLRGNTANFRRTGTPGRRQDLSVPVLELPWLSWWLVRDPAYHGDMPDPLQGHRGLPVPRAEAAEGPGVQFHCRHCRLATHTA